MSIRDWFCKDSSDPTKKLCIPEYMYVVDKLKPKLVIKNSSEAGGFSAGLLTIGRE